MDEATLITRYLRGDNAAADRLLRPWQGPLYGFLLRRLRDPADAEDALQETFLKALRALPGYREEGHFRAWLYRIAWNEALSTLRQRQKENRTMTTEPEIHDRPGDDAPHWQRMVVREDLQRLRTGIGKLPEKEREVVDFRIREGLTFREIATITGDPLNTLLGRMRNATRRLRAYMTEAEI